jgi:hypothetical protein
MIQIQKSIPTTTLIRRAGSTALGTWYDFTDSGISTQEQKKLQSLLDQAILQWWNGLPSYQKSGPSAYNLNFKISVSL